MSTILGFHNLLDTALVTASSSPAAHPAKDGCDYLTTDYWQPEGVAPWDFYVDARVVAKADYVALMGESLGTVELAYIPSGSTTYTPVVSKTTATSVVMIPFTATTAQKWRLRFTGISAPKVAHISLGQRTTLPVKLQSTFTEPKRALLDKVETSVTQAGKFAGRSVVKRGLSFELDLKLLEPEWVDAHWPAWRVHMETNGPFFVLWDTTNRPNDAAFLWPRDLTKMGGPRQAHARYVDISLDLEGVA